MLKKMEERREYKYKNGENKRVIYRNKEGFYRMMAERRI